MAKFEIKKEHIKLIENLTFICRNTPYDDTVIPAIDLKRPFGNSSVLYDAMQKLGYVNSYGDYTEESKDKTRLFLIELPVALEIITSKHTFETGVYDIDEYGAYFSYTQALVSQVTE